MAKVYVTRCIVKKNGKSYQKGSVIEKLTEEEIKQGLAEHWLDAVGNSEDPEEKKSPKPKKPGKPGKPGKPDQDDPLEKMAVNELLAEAADLGLQIDSSMSSEELCKIIREARQ
jgi:hypothetical protein